MPPNVASANILLISLELWWGWRRKSIFKGAYDFWENTQGRFPCRVSLWALCKWTATASTREGGEGVQSSQQEQAFAFVPRSWLFHTCWASPRRDCLWFPTWKKALAFRTLSPERGCGDLQIQPLPPPFSETAKRVLRIMTNVSSNRLLPSVSGRRQPRALATVTGNS